MRIEDHVELNSATPEYVLAVLVDEHRQQCELDPEADPDALLTFETTVEEWRDACDLLPWRALGRALDDDWHLGYSDSDWRSVLEPAKNRTLRDVCRFIADRATAAHVTPAKMMGQNCMSAGAFFAICSRLRNAGVDVSAISPSTPLADYTRKHTDVFLRSISRLAPNALPKVKIEHPWYDRCLMGIGLSLLLGFLSILLANWKTEFLWLVATFVATGVVSYIGIWLAAKRPPKAVEFGDLKTFRDLAGLIAKQSSM